MDDTYEIFVPGRVCLFGEHSDWAGSFRRFNSALEPGRTIVVGTNDGLFARVRRHPSSLIMTTTTDKGERIGPVEIPMNAKALLSVAKEGGFWSYAAGVAYRILTDYRVSGVVIDNYRTTLPLKKGLSSSAAVCVLVAQAFNHAFQLLFTTRAAMEYAYQGELLTPSRCGRMDQACAFGSRPVDMLYDGDFLDVKPLSVGRPLHLVLVDLNAKKDTVEILAKLQACFPFAKSEDEEHVQALLGPINQDITRRAAEAIEGGDVAEVGRLMAEAQRHFDEYGGKVCPSQLTAPVLHSVLGHKPLEPHVYGGKGVGAGGDGTAQFLARSAEDQKAVAAIIERDFGMSSLFVTVEPSTPVRKALIPAAGFGAGLFPATKACKPELFPVLDSDGIAKPAILLNVEQLVAAGIEEVVIVVQREDVPTYTRLFQERVTPANYNRLTPAARRYADELLELGKRVRFIVQERQEGLGHAVLCAKEALGDGPFMLMLGDHLYRAGAASGPSCTEQVVAEYKRSGSTTVGLKRSPAADVSAFGCATGAWLDHDDTSEAGRRLLAISEMAEKPSLAYAREKLLVPTLPDDEFLTAFGLYVLTPAVFSALEHLVAHNLRGHGGEYQLTEALEHVRRTEGLTGVVVDGKRYDLGTPEHYLEAIVGLHAGRGAGESSRIAAVADVAGPSAGSVPVSGSASGAAASASPV